MLGTLNPAARVLDGAAVYFPAGSSTTTLYHQQRPAGQAAPGAADMMPAANWSRQTWQPYSIGSEDFRREAYAKMVTGALCLGAGAVLGAVIGTVAALRRG